jgi:hypothetical protein
MVVMRFGYLLTTRGSALDSTYRADEVIDEARAFENNTLFFSGIPLGQQFGGHYAAGETT